jgi:adenosylmethionine-8-amino-7-oxononanoate aminotransferase
MSPHAILNDGNTVTDSSNVAITKDEESHVLHRSLHHKPYTIVAAEGLYLTLSNGQRILDATGGPAVSCLGHNNARVKAAIAKQMDEVSYCHSLVYSTRVAEELADELIRGTEGKMARSFIISSGKAAIEINMRYSFVHAKPSYRI